MAEPPGHAARPEAESSVAPLRAITGASLRPRPRNDRRNLTTSNVPLNPLGFPSAMKRGMIHGRFQPFHNGHLEYMRGAAERSDELWVGITNPDPARILPEASDPARHLPESNPYSYDERLLMVKAAAADLELDLERVHVIPFPVNEPDLWGAYVPEGITQYLRLFSSWGGEKHERLRAAGYEVVILDEGAEKQLSGADVRAAMRSGAEWETLVPPGVARVLRDLDWVAV
jgi:cytidyltransferase-like protein